MRSRPAAARATSTCSIDRNGPVSPVLTATLPSIAASTTRAGVRAVARRTPAPVARHASSDEDGAAPVALGRPPDQQGEERARAERQRHGHPDSAGAEAEGGEVERDEDAEIAVAEGADRLRREDEPDGGRRNGPGAMASQGYDGSPVRQAKPARTHAVVASRLLRYRM